MNKQEQAASVAVIGSTSEAYARKEEIERCIFSADFMRFIMAQPSPDYWTPRPLPLLRSDAPNGRGPGGLNQDARGRRRMGEPHLQL